MGYKQRASYFRPTPSLFISQQTANDDHDDADHNDHDDVDHNSDEQNYDEFEENGDHPTIHPSLANIVANDYHDPDDVDHNHHDSRLICFLLSIIDAT